MRSRSPRRLDAADDPFAGVRAYRQRKSEETEDIVKALDAEEARSKEAAAAQARQLREQLAEEERRARNERLSSEHAAKEHAKRGGAVTQELVSSPSGDLHEVAAPAIEPGRGLRYVPREFKASETIDGNPAWQESADGEIYLARRDEDGRIHFDRPLSMDRGAAVDHDEEGNLFFKHPDMPDYRRPVTDADMEQPRVARAAAAARNKFLSRQESVYRLESSVAKAEASEASKRVKAEAKRILEARKASGLGTEELLSLQKVEAMEPAARAAQVPGLVKQLRASGQDELASHYENLLNVDKLRDDEAGAIGEADRLQALAVEASRARLGKSKPGKGGHRPVDEDVAADIPEPAPAGPPVVSRETYQQVKAAKQSGIPTPVHHVASQVDQKASQLAAERDALAASDAPESAKRLLTVDKELKRLESDRAAMSGIAQKEGQAYVDQELGAIGAEFHRPAAEFKDAMEAEFMVPRDKALPSSGFSESVDRVGRGIREELGIFFGGANEWRKGSPEAMGGAPGKSPAERVATVPVQDRETLMKRLSGGRPVLNPHRVEASLLNPNSGISWRVDLETLAEKGEVSPEEARQLFERHEAGETRAREVVKDYMATLRPELPEWKVEEVAAKHGLQKAGPNLWAVGGLREEQNDREFLNSPWENPEIADELADYALDAGLTGDDIAKEVRNIIFGTTAKQLTTSLAGGALELGGAALSAVGAPDVLARPREAVRAVEAGIDQLLPLDPRQSDAWYGLVSQGLASTIGFAYAGAKGGEALTAAGKSIKTLEQAQNLNKVRRAALTAGRWAGINRITPEVAQKLAIASTGALVEIDAGLKEARQAGVPEDQLLKLALMYGGLGASEVIGAEGLLKKMQSTIARKAFGRTVLSLIKEPIEEWGQETFQSGGENLIAQAHWDNTRELSKGLPEAGFSAVSSAGLLSVLGTIVGRRRMFNLRRSLEVEQARAARVDPSELPAAQQKFQLAAEQWQTALQQAQDSLADPNLDPAARADLEQQAEDAAANLHYAQQMSAFLRPLNDEQEIEDAMEALPALGPGNSAADVITAVQALRDISIRQKSTPEKTRRAQELGLALLKQSAGRELSTAETALLKTAKLADGSPLMEEGPGGLQLTPSGILSLRDISPHAYKLYESNQRKTGAYQQASLSERPATPRGRKAPQAGQGASPKGKAPGKAPPVQSPAPAAPAAEAVKSAPSAKASPAVASSNPARAAGILARELVRRGAPPPLAKQLAEKWVAEHPDMPVEEAREKITADLQAKHAEFQGKPPEAKAAPAASAPAAKEAPAKAVPPTVWDWDVSFERVTYADGRVVLSPPPIRVPAHTPGEAKEKALARLTRKYPGATVEGSTVAPVRRKTDEKNTASAAKEAPPAAKSPPAAKETAAAVKPPPAAKETPAPKAAPVVASEAIIVTGRTDNLSADGERALEMLRSILASPAIQAVARGMRALLGKQMRVVLDSSVGGAGMKFYPGDDSLHVNLERMAERMAELAGGMNAAAWYRAGIDEEIKHWVATSLADPASVIEMWRSLPEETQKRVIQLYGASPESYATEDEAAFNLGHEYLRMMLQLANSGQTTEVAGLMTPQARTVFQKILAALRAILGLAPEAKAPAIPETLQGKLAAAAELGADLEGLQNNALVWQVLHQYEAIAKAGVAPVAAAPTAEDEESRPPRVGDEATIMLPESVEQPARYELVDMNSVRMHPDNERDYSSKEEREKNEWMLARFSPRMLINSNPDATNGPTIVNRRTGNILGGHRRYLLATDRRSRQAYRALLARHAREFGIRVDQIEENDLLVRYVDVPADEEHDYIRVYNVPPMGSIPISYDAVSAGRVIPADTLRLIGEVFAAHPDTPPLQALLDGVSAEVVADLLKAKAIRPLDKPKYVKPNGKLKREGARYIRFALLGNLIDDAEVLENMEDTAMENKLLNGLQGIFQAKALGVDIAPLGGAVLEELARDAAEIRTIEEWQSQGRFSEVDDRLTPEVAILQRVLGAVNQGNARRVFKGIADLVAPLEKGQGGMLENNRATLGSFNADEAGAIFEKVANAIEAERALKAEAERQEKHIRALKKQAKEGKGSPAGAALSMADYSADPVTGGKTRIVEGYAPKMSRAERDTLREQRSRWAEVSRAANAIVDRINAEEGRVPPSPPLTSMPDWLGAHGAEQAGETLRGLLAEVPVIKREVINEKLPDAFGTGGSESAVWISNRLKAVYKVRHTFAEANFLRVQLEFVPASALLSYDYLLAINAMESAPRTELVGWTEEGLPVFKQPQLHSYLAGRSAHELDENQLESMVMRRRAVRMNRWTYLVHTQDGYALVGDVGWSNTGWQWKEEGDATRSAEFQIHDPVIQAVSEEEMEIPGVLKSLREKLDAERAHFELFMADLFGMPDEKDGEATPETDEQYIARLERRARRLQSQAKTTPLTPHEHAELASIEVALGQKFIPGTEPEVASPVTPAAKPPPSFRKLQAGDIQNDFLTDSTTGKPGFGTSDQGSLFAADPARESRFDQNAPWVMALASRWHTPGVMEGDDAKQIAAMALYRATARADLSPADFPRYAAASVRNALRDEWRRVAKGKTFEVISLDAPVGTESAATVADVVPDVSARPADEAAVTAETLRIAEQALESLPESVRSVVRLHLDGHSGIDIALAHGVEFRHARVRGHRMKRRAFVLLRRALRRRGVDLNGSGRLELLSSLGSTVGRETTERFLAKQGVLPENLAAATADLSGSLEKLALSAADPSAPKYNTPALLEKWFTVHHREGAPMVRLGGLWLEQAGFPIGGRFSMQLEQGRIVLTPAEAGERVVSYYPGRRGAYVRIAGQRLDATGFPVGQTFKMVMQGSSLVLTPAAKPPPRHRPPKVGTFRGDGLSMADVQQDLFFPQMLTIEPDVSPAATPPEPEHAALTFKDSPAELSAKLDKHGLVSRIVPSLIAGDLPKWDVRGAEIEGPADVAALAFALRSPYFEVSKLLVLDDDMRVVLSEVLHIGTLDESFADIPRVLLAVARARRLTGKPVSKVIFSHNHPSGDVSPSEADRRSTVRMKERLKQHKLELVDHVITDGETVHSLDRDITEPVSLRASAWENAPVSAAPIMGDTLRPAFYLAGLRQGQAGNGAAHILYLSTRLRIQAVERLPVEMVKPGKLFAHAERTMALHGARFYLLELPPSANKKIYDLAAYSVLRAHEKGDNKHPLLDIFYYPPGGAGNPPVSATMRDELAMADFPQPEPAAGGERAEFIEKVAGKMFPEWFYGWRNSSDGEESIKVRRDKDRANDIADAKRGAETMSPEAFRRLVAHWENYTWDNPPYFQPTIAAGLLRAGTGYPAGPRWADVRQSAIESILGRRIPKSQAGITRLREVLETYFQPPPGQTMNGRERFVWQQLRRVVERERRHEPDGHLLHLFDSPGMWGRYSGKTRRDGGGLTQYQIIITESPFERMIGQDQWVSEPPPSLASVDLPGAAPAAPSPSPAPSAPPPPPRADSSGQLQLFMSDAEAAAAGFTQKWYHGGKAGYNELGLPAFLARTPEFAAWFADERGDGSIYPVYVNPQRVLDLTAPGEERRRALRLLHALKRERVTEIVFQGDTDPEGDGPWEFHAPEVRKHALYFGDSVLDLTYIPKVREYLRKQGFSAVVDSDMLESSEDAVTVVVDPAVMALGRPLDRAALGLDMADVPGGTNYVDGNTVGPYVAPDGSRRHQPRRRNFVPGLVKGRGPLRPISEFVGFLRSAGFGDFGFADGDRFVLGKDGEAGRGSVIVVAGAAAPFVYVRYGPDGVTELGRSAHLDLPGTFEAARRDGFTRLGVRLVNTEPAPPPFSVPVRRPVPSRPHIHIEEREFLVPPQLSHEDIERAAAFRARFNAVRREMQAEGWDVWSPVADWNLSGVRRVEGDREFPVVWHGDGWEGVPARVRALADEIVPASREHAQYWRAVFESDPTGVLREPHQTALPIREMPEKYRLFLLFDTSAPPSPRQEWNKEPGFNGYAQVVEAADNDQNPVLLVYEMQPSYREPTGGMDEQERLDRLAERVVAYARSRGLPVAVVTPSAAQRVYGRPEPVSRVFSKAYGKGSATRRAFLNALGYPPRRAEIAGRVPVTAMVWRALSPAEARRAMKQDMKAQARWIKYEALREKKDNFEADHDWLMKKFVEWRAQRWAPWKDAGAGGLAMADVMFAAPETFRPIRAPGYAHLQGSYNLLHVTTRPDTGIFQLTRYDERGPMGHDGYDTLPAALEALHYEGPENQVIEDNRRKLRIAHDEVESPDDSGSYLDPARDVLAVRSQAREVLEEYNADLFGEDRFVYVGAEPVSSEAPGRPSPMVAFPLNLKAGSNSRLVHYHILPSALTLEQMEATGLVPFFIPSSMHPSTKGSGLAYYSAIAERLHPGWRTVRRGGQAGAALPWPTGFPDVVLMSSGRAVTSSEFHPRAKEGDELAAVAIVSALGKPDKLRALAKAHPGAAWVPVVAIEAAGENRIPLALAQYASHVTGLPVVTDIVQANIVARTGKGAWYRMGVRPRFDGPVEAGREYILVDDFVTAGGTFGELRRHIEAKGGRVVGTVALGSGLYSHRLALRPETRLNLERKFGRVELSEILRQHRIYNGEYRALTEAEARLLLKAENVAAIGARITEAVREGFRAAHQRDAGQPDPTPEELREFRGWDKDEPPALAMADVDARFADLERRAKKGDKRAQAQAQEMVNEKALEAGYSRGPVSHGTTHAFDVFEVERSNVENNLGRGIYLSSSEEDVENNYAGIGPDLTSRIERRAEQLLGSMDSKHKDLKYGTPEYAKAQASAKRQARRELAGKKKRAIRALVRLEAPAIIGGPDQTMLTFETAQDEEGNYTGEESGSLLDFIAALRLEASKHDDGNAEEAIGEIINQALDGEISLQIVDEILREDSGFGTFTDENGDITSYEIFRAALERMGFDGIVDFTVNQKFGTARRYGQAMSGIDEDTYHVVAFKPHSIKSADPFTYDVQGALIPLSERFNPHKDSYLYMADAERNAWEWKVAKHLTRAGVPFDRAVDLVQNRASSLEVATDLVMVKRSPDGQALSPEIRARRREMARSILGILYGDGLYMADQLDFWNSMNRAADAAGVERLPATPPAPANMPAPAGPVADFGQKLGGARKDLVAARPAKKDEDGEDDEDEDDNVPGWRQRFRIVPPLPENHNKYSLYLSKRGDWVQVRDRVEYKKVLFDTEAEAEAAIPYHAARLRHFVSTVAASETKEASFAIYRRLGERGAAVVKDGFKSKEQADEYLRANAIEILGHRFAFPERPWLDAVRRVGGDRRGGRDATAQMFTDTFRFRGVEFGNWNMGADGQAALNHAYDALLDFADILGVPPSALSLNGELGLAFGARGHGGKEAARAHYERDYAVINLTKIHGAGTLAHEWLHAVDHYLGRQSLGAERLLGPEETYQASKLETLYATTIKPYERKKLRTELGEALERVLGAIFNKTVKKSGASLLPAHEARLQRATEYLETRLADVERQIELSHKYGKGKQPTPAQSEEMRALVAKIKAATDLGEKVYHAPNKASRYDMGLNTWQALIDLHNLAKKVSGRGLISAQAESTGKRIHHAISDLLSARESHKRLSAATDVEVSVTTDFVNESRKIDRSRASPYWATRIELAARSFEAFIYDRLAEEGRQSDYLVHGVDNKFYVAFGAKPYPEGQEREDINTAWRGFFQTIRATPTERGTALSMADAPLGFHIPRQLQGRSLKLKKNHVVIGYVSFPDYVPMATRQYPHDGTPEGAVRVAVGIRANLEHGISHSATLTLATDDTAAFRWVISPNGNIHEIASPDGQWALGDLDAHSKDRARRAGEALRGGNTKQADAILVEEVNEKLRFSRPDLLDEEYDRAREARAFRAAGEPVGTMDDRYNKWEDYLGQIRARAGAFGPDKKVLNEALHVVDKISDPELRAAQRKRVMEMGALLHKKEVEVRRAVDGTAAVKGGDVTDAWVIPGARVSYLGRVVPVLRVYDYGFRQGPRALVSWYGQTRTVSVTELSVPEMSNQELFMADAPPFYSMLRRVIEEKMPATAPAAQVLGIVQSPGNGVKAEEIKWSGVVPAVERLAEAGKGKVSRAALLKYLAREGAVRFEEKTYGEPAAAGEWEVAKNGTLMRRLGNRWTHIWPQPDGTAIAQAPSKFVHTFGSVQEAKDHFDKLEASTAYVPTRFSRRDLQIPGGENYREVVLTMPSRDKSGDSEGRSQDEQEAYERDLAAIGEYRSQHFPDARNYIAHVRFNERRDDERRPGLFIEEIQSDRHQTGRKERYRDDEETEKRVQKLNDKASEIQRRDGITPEVESILDEMRALRDRQRASVPDAPYRSTWPLAMFKRALARAVASGKEWIGWTTGADQSERYDLSKQIEKVMAYKRNDGSYDFMVTPKGERGHRDISNVSEAKLSETIGKEMAEKVSAQPVGEWMKYEGLDLKVGGGGMLKFYDEMLPKEVGRYVKQWGASVVKGHISPELMGEQSEFDIGLALSGMSEEEWMEASFDDQYYWIEEARKHPIWRVDITPEMRAGVEAGQALFMADVQPDLFSPRPASSGSPLDVEDPFVRSLMGIGQNSSPPPAPSSVVPARSFAARISELQAKIEDLAARKYKKNDTLLPQRDEFEKARSIGKVNEIRRNRALWAMRRQIENLQVWHVLFTEKRMTARELEFYNTASIQDLETEAPDTSESRVRALAVRYVEPLSMADIPPGRRVPPAPQTETDLRQMRVPLKWRQPPARIPGGEHAGEYPAKPDVAGQQGFPFPSEGPPLTVPGGEHAGEYPPKPETTGQQGFPFPPKPPPPLAGGQWRRGAFGQPIWQGQQGLPLHRPPPRRIPEGARKPRTSAGGEANDGRAGSDISIERANIERIAGAIDEGAPPAEAGERGALPHRRTVFRDFVINLTAGTWDRMDYYAPGTKAVIQDYNRNIALARASLRSLYDRLRQDVERAFGSPSWWRHPARWRRLRSFVNELLPLAAHLEVDTVDAENDQFVWKAHDMRVGLLTMEQATEFRLLPGMTFYSTTGEFQDIGPGGKPITRPRGAIVVQPRMPPKNAGDAVWDAYRERRAQFNALLSSGAIEQLTVGEKVGTPEGDYYFKLRHVPVARQDALYSDFVQRYPEGRQFLDRWLDPGGAKTRFKHPAGLETAEFNRMSLLSLYEGTPYGELPYVTGYTPDVAYQRTFIDLVVSQLRRYLSPARKVKTGEAREQGNVRDLFQGWEIRTEQAHRETLLAQQRAALLEKALVHGDTIPEAQKAQYIGQGQAGVYLSLDEVVAQLTKMQAALSGLKLPHPENALHPENRKFVDAVVGDGGRRTGQGFYIHQAVYAELVRTVGSAESANLLLKIGHGLLHRLNAGLLAAPGTLITNMVSNEIFKTMRAANRFYYALLSATFGEGKTAELSLREGYHIVRGLLLDRFTNSITRDRITAMAPNELFTGQSAVEAIGIDTSLSAWEQFKRVNLGAALLKLYKYEEVDIAAKKQLAYAAYRAHAEVAYRDAVRQGQAPDGLTGEALRSWQAAWVSAQPESFHREVYDAVVLAIMDYANVPSFLDSSHGTLVERMAKSGLLPFVKFPYNFLRQMKRSSFDAVVALAAPGSTKAERLQGAANLLVWVTLAALGVLAGGDDDDESLIGSSVDEEGRRLDSSARTANRLKVTGPVRTVLAYFKMATGRDLFDDTKLPEEAEYWLHYRKYPYVGPALLLGTVLRGRWLQSREILFNQVEEYVTSGILAKIIAGVFGYRDEFDANKNLGWVYSEAALDVTTAGAVPPSIRRLLVEMVDPVARRNRASLRLGYEANAQDALRANIPGLSAGLPPAGYASSVAADNPKLATVLADYRRMGVDPARATRRYLNEEGTPMVAYVEPATIRRTPTILSALRLGVGMNLRPFPSTRDPYEEALKRQR